ASLRSLLLLADHEPVPARYHHPVGAREHRGLDRQQVALEPPRARGVARAVVGARGAHDQGAVGAERQDHAPARGWEVGAAAEEDEALAVLLVAVQPGPVKQLDVYLVSHR